MTIGVLALQIKYKYYNTLRIQKDTKNTLNERTH